MYTQRLQTYKKGEVIFTEGSHGDDAFVIQSGEVNILKSGANQQPVVLRTIGPNEMFGEMALITDNPRIASAAAKTDVTLEVINRNAFGLKMQSDPEFAMQTVRRLAGMIPETQAHLLTQMRAQEDSRNVAEKGGVFAFFRGRKGQAAAFAPDFVQIDQEPVPATVKYAGFAIIGLLITALAWASIATTDTTVVGTGRVITTVPNISVQPFDNGIVRQVDVREGQLVKKGQLLATLDPTLAAADLKSASDQMASTEAQVVRLQAELAGTTPAKFSEDRLEDAIQRQLFVARTQQFRATVNSNDEEIRNLEGQIVARRAEAQDLTRQLGVLRDLTALREQYFKKEKEVFLREGQYRIQYLDALRAQTAAEREMTQLKNTLASLEVQIRGKQAQRDAWVSDWKAKANQELVTALRERARLSEQLKKVDRANALVEIVAPTDAIVLSVRTRTPGTVLRSAEAMFELVAVDVPLEIELDVSPRDVARLRPGDSVTVKIDALPFIRHGTIDGKLRLISEDTFDKSTSGQPGPLYRARIELGERRLVQVPEDFRLVPGMTVTGDIKTGTRRLITFITYPITRAMSTSFREP